MDRGTVRRAAVLACAGLAAPAGTSCTFDTEPHLSRVGTAVLEWTVGGRHDAESCVALGSRAAYVEARDDDGALEDEVTVACDAFAVRIPLREGQYTATLTLLRDADSAPAAPPVSIALRIRAGVESRAVFEVAPRPLE